MEKLTMNAPKETCACACKAALDAGIDGITLAAGLHLGSFGADRGSSALPRRQAGHHRFLAARAAALPEEERRTNRLPDYVVVEGPLAGGHLGFGMDWAQYDLATIVAEIIAYLQAEQLDIPVIPAGGIFTGSDAVSFLETGAAAVQVATRFTVTEECGLPRTSSRSISRPAKTTSRSTDLAHRLSDAHAEDSPASATASAPTAKPTATCSTPTASAPTSLPTTARWRSIPGGKQGQGHGQDLPVHPHAQLRYLDLRPLHLSAEGHHAPQCRRQLPAAERRAHLPDYQFRQGFGVFRRGHGFFGKRHATRAQQAAPAIAGCAVFGGVQGDRILADHLLQLVGQCLTTRSVFPGAACLRCSGAGCHRRFVGKSHPPVRPDDCGRPPALAALAGVSTVNANAQNKPDTTRTVPGAVTDRHGGVCGNVWAVACFTPVAWVTTGSMGLCHTLMAQQGIQRWVHARETP
jgi:NAD(P)H-dependent flavin oxidoreductase YrpB (nitropropane dioxygenase family)